MIKTLGTTTNFVIKHQDTDTSTTPASPFANVLRRAERTHSHFLPLPSSGDAAAGGSSRRRRG